MSRILQTDYALEIAKGNVAKHSSILKVGENPDIDTASGFEHVWDGGGSYVPPTAARLHDVVSTSALDAGTLLSSGTATGGTAISLIDTSATFIADGVVAGDLLLVDTTCNGGTISAVISETEIQVAGGIRSPNTGRVEDPVEAGNTYRVVTNASTGASVFHILGLSPFFASQEEFVILDGLTPVTTTKTWIRQHRARVLGQATTGAVGVITSTAQEDGTVTCQVVDGNNQTLMAIWTTPVTQDAYIRRWWGSLSRKTAAIATLRLRTGGLANIGWINRARTVSSSGSSNFLYEFDVPQFVPGGADIWVEADTDTNNTGISAGFDLILVDV